MADQSPGARLPVRAAADGRLDSWKEIAAYLNRDVTTVQRWEKREGMPVHRHVHDKLGSVYSYRAELDAWSRTRKLRASEEPASEPDQAGGFEKPDNLAPPPPLDVDGNGCAQQAAAAVRLGAVGSSRDPRPGGHALSLANGVLLA